MEKESETDYPWLVRELPITQLHEHEEIEPHRLQEVLAHLRKTGWLREPIVVDTRSFVILDGHHRFHACKELGFQTIPCILVDYFSDHVCLYPRRSNIPVTKQEVIARALRGELYPPKTTRHVFRGLSRTHAPSS